MRQDAAGGAGEKGHIPTTVFYERGTKGTGETNINVLQLTLVSNPGDPLYKINAFFRIVYPLKKSKSIKMITKVFVLASI